MPSATSLTGVWIGRYAYPRTLEPVEFTATVIESGSHVTGATSEVPSGGNALLFATIFGDHAGSSVDFVKTYDATNQMHDLPILYSGTLNSDATQIAGTWAITGHLSGTFVMTRELRKAKARKREAHAPI